MKTRIVSDSSCDIWGFEDVDLVTVPLTISTGEKTFVDDDTLDVPAMLDYLAAYKGRSYTACPSMESWLKAFEGADVIYVVTMTGTLSGTYNSALAARQVYLEQHPDAKILVMDSLSTSADQLLLVEKLRDLVLAGRSFEEISREMAAYQKKTRLFFAFRSLHNFAQNGRVPKIVAQAIGAFGISVIGTASEDGRVKPTSKERGKKAVVTNLLSQIINAGYHGGRLRVCHVQNEELARQIVDAVKAKFAVSDIRILPSRGLVAYYSERYGVVIGCECN